MRRLSLQHTPACLATGGATQHEHCQPMGEGEGRLNVTTSRQVPCPTKPVSPFSLLALLVFRLLTTSKSFPFVAVLARAVWTGHWPPPWCPRPVGSKHHRWNTPCSLASSRALAISVVGPTRTTSRIWSPTRCWPVWHSLPVPSSEMHGAVRRQR